MPGSPPTDAWQEAGSHCCEEGRESNLASRGSQEGAPLTLPLPPPVLRLRSHGLAQRQTVEGHLLWVGKGTAWQASGACYLGTFSVPPPHPGSASAVPEGTQAPLAPISPRAQPTAVFLPHVPAKLLGRGKGATLSVRDLFAWQGIRHFCVVTVAPSP